MKVLLTGYSGFVGSNLSNDASDHNDFEVIKLDFRKSLPLELRSAFALIHLAGKAHDLKNITANEEYLAVNFKRTASLFDLFLKSDIRDFIYFSSVKAVADVVDDFLDENVVPSPKTFYGVSKYLAERYILEQPIPAGKRVFILRPCMIHGSGNKGNLNSLYRLIRSGFPYPLGAFQNKRSYLSIENLLFVLNQILRNSIIKGGIYNIAYDVPLSTNEVVEIISEGIIGLKTRIWHIHPTLIKVLCSAIDRLNLPLNTNNLTKLTTNYVVSNVKLKSALNIINLPTSSRNGLFSTIKSFQSY